MKLAVRKNAVTPPHPQPLPAPPPPPPRPPVVYSHDGGGGDNLTLCCFVVYPTWRFLLCLALCYFVLGSLNANRFFFGAFMRTDFLCIAVK